MGKGESFPLSLVSHRINACTPLRLDANCQAVLVLDLLIAKPQFIARAQHRARRKQGNDHVRYTTADSLKTLQRSKSGQY